MVSSPTPSGIYAVAIILGVFSIGAIALRFAARRALARRSDLRAWRSDDWLLFITMLLLWALSIILIYDTGAVIVTPHENQIAMFGAILQILAVLALGTLKAGVVLFYRRIFVSNFFFATLLECKGQNLALLWKSIQTFKQQCYEYKTIQLAHCVTDVATDLIVLALPLREIWNLHMKTQQKINVSLIFLIGALSTAAGIARLVVVATDIIETTAGARDVRGVETNVMLWTFVEVGVAIIAACLPTLGPLANWRSVNSIIASVRSRVSLNSVASSQRRNIGSQKLRYDDLELRPYDGPHTLNSQSKIGYTDTPYPSTDRTTIRRDDAVTVWSETAE